MRLKDTNGKESTTLSLVVVAYAALLLKFLVGGLDIFGLGTAPVIGAGEFGLAMTGLLGVWLNREWKEAKHANKDSSSY